MLQILNLKFTIGHFADNHFILSFADNIFGNLFQEKQIFTQNL